MIRKITKKADNDELLQIYALYVKERLLHQKIKTLFTYNILQYALIFAEAYKAF